MKTYFKKHKQIFIPAIFFSLAGALLFSLIFSFPPSLNYERKFLEKKELSRAELKQEALNQKIFISPYENINWERIKFYHANFHTHTNLSDGLLSPEEVIKFYQENNYHILALTDHDNMRNYQVTWPRDIYPEIKEEENSFLFPGQEFLLIKGNEISDVHHLGSLFNDYGGGAFSEGSDLKEISLRNGLAILFHPGRYNYDLNFYTDLFNKFPSLLGLEVYNQNDRYSRDRELLDALLNELLPERIFWAFADDDMHDPELHFSFNRNIFPLESLNEGNLREAIKHGSFFFFKANESGLLPGFEIKEIYNSGEKIEIEIIGDYEKIEWLSFNPDKNLSEVVGSTNKILIKDLNSNQKFVRFVVSSESGQFYSQAFMIR